MERVSTGIDGLDVKLNGGYPKGKGILVTGVSGSGKTIFGLHFIHKCCADGKKCVMIASEETAEDVLHQAEMLGLDLAKYYENGQFVIERVYEIRSHKTEQMVEYGLTQFGSAFEGPEIIELTLLADYVPEGTEVVVLDNIGVFTFRSTVQEFREQFDALNYILFKRGCTAMFVMDEAAYDMTKHTADYSVYGSVRLMIKENPYTGKVERYLTIPKMRSTDVLPDLMVFDITSKGIKLRQPKQENPS